jgi:hypothetical protein
VSLFNGLIQWRKAADGNDGPLWTLDDRTGAAPDGLASQCCCCDPCIIRVGGVDTDIGCACVYTVTLSGLTGIFAGYNGVHEMTKPGGGCTWNGETLTIDDTLTLEFFENTWIVALSLDGGRYATIWGKNWDMATCNIEGSHPWVSTDGPSQSGSTCTVSA